MSPAASNLRLLTYPTVFGVVWGATEMVLGSYLHMVHFPFTGAILSGFGAVILCVERAYTPVFRASLYTGVIAVLFKFISPGSVRLSPALAIMVEALLAEAVLTGLGPNFKGFIVTGCLCCLEGVPHFIVSYSLRYGAGIYSSLRQATERLACMLGLSLDLWSWLILVWIGVHLAVGLLAGLIALAVIGFSGSRMRAS